MTIKVNQTITHDNDVYNFNNPYSSVMKKYNYELTVLLTSISTYLIWMKLPQMQQQL